MTNKGMVHRTSEEQQRIIEIVWRELLGLQTGLQHNLMPTVQCDVNVPAERQMDVVMSLISHMMLSAAVDFVWMNMQEKNGKTIKDMFRSFIDQFVTDLEREHTSLGTSTVQ
jgi:hypothetical protein